MNCFGDCRCALNRRADAAAFISGSESYRGIAGRVLFYSVRGGVLVRAEVEGLPMGNAACESPVFAFHIHSGGDCTPRSGEAFTGAGAHYNPRGCEHPYHAGDLLPLLGAGGRAFSAFLTDRFTVDEVIGKTVIIHLMPDDFYSQPAGNAGERIACGIITPTAR